MIIIFNSAGAKFNGFDSKYEFFNLPFGYPADCIRISQSEPSRWYLDDMDLIKQVVLLKKYSNIICVGISMGGYASIWLSEMLSEVEKDVFFYSITVQAPTSISLEYCTALRYKYSDRDKQRFKVLDYQNIMKYQNEDKILDISKFLSIAKNNVKHFLIFDYLNDFERYNATRLSSERVDRIAMPFGTDHMDGSYQIAISGVLEKLLDEILWSN